MFSILLGIYLGMELLDHTVTLCLTFWGTVKLFFKISTSFYIPTINGWVFHFLHIFVTLVIVFLCDCCLVGVKCYLTKALICTSLMTNDVTHPVMWLYILLGEMSIHIFSSLKIVFLLETELPYDPAIPLLGTDTKEIRSERDTCIPVFIAALFYHSQDMEAT